MVLLQFLFLSGGVIAPALIDVVPESDTRHPLMDVNYMASMTFIIIYDPIVNPI
jgi:hypothetical protein